MLVSFSDAPAATAASRRRRLISVGAADSVGVCVVGEVAELGLGPLGALQRGEDHGPILVLELLQHGCDRRLALGGKSVGGHPRKVVGLQPDFAP